MGNITFKKTVLDKVSSDLDVPYEKLNSIFNFFLKELEEETSKPDTYSVRIPYLGVLYLKYHLIKKRRMSKSYDAKARFLKKREFGKYYYHLRAKKMNTKFYTEGKTITELEEFQNEEKN